MTEQLNNSNNTLASLVWGLEASQQCENFFGMIVLQFVGHPPSSSVVELMVELTSSKRTYANTPHFRGLLLPVLLSPEQVTADQR